MKKLFSYSIILMALCALVSCSNDDDNNGSGSGKNAKKLLSMDYKTYIYNDNGRLAQIKAGAKSPMIFTWTLNSVTADLENPEDYYDWGTHYSSDFTTGLLSGDRIIQINGLNYTTYSFEYNGDKLAKISPRGSYFEDDDIATIKWSGDNITEISGSAYYKNTPNITYYPDKKGNGTIDIMLLIMPYLGHAIGNDCLLYAHPWLMGRGNKNLIKSIYIKDSNNIYDNLYDLNEYTYKFDSNGNPTEIYETKKYYKDGKYTGTSNETKIATMTWEQ